MSAPDTQVALSRIQRGTSSGMSRATRQAVAPFLQKLYEMVSDSATDNLIRWSDSGDSFFVLDHERVAHDVLPRWFKHSNFASFVRQLNMYGFHKIPHLQQGVLKSDTETELWNFEHPNFHRGQPDLLCLISRKKQATDRPADEIQAEPKDASLFPTTTANGSVIDVNSIVNGITAIKRHQATISADLNDLKASNQHLWQEAIAARERHNKHQDTINKILKFLASVFGNASTPHKGPSDASTIPRKRQRLMIEGGTSSEERPRSAVSPEHPMASTKVESIHNTDGLSTNSFATVETPSDTSARIYSVTPQAEILDIPTPRPEDSPMAESASSPPYPGNLPTVNTAGPFVPVDPLTSQSMLSPLAQNSSNNQDAVLQAILNSPQQLQKLMGVLNLQQGFPSGPALDMSHIQPSNMMSSMGSSLSQGPLFSPTPPPSNFSEPSHDSSSYLPLLRNEDNANFGPLLDNTTRFQTAYKDASDINADVDSLQSSIDALIENLGLNPSNLDNPRLGNDISHPDEDPILNRETSSNTVFQDPHDPHLTQGGSAIPDFDVDAFLRELNKQNSTEVDNFDSSLLNGSSSAGTTSDQLSAYVDEVASQSDPASPATARVSLDEAPPPVEIKTQGKKSQKRKSDVAEIPPEKESTVKPKRKR